MDDKRIFNDLYIGNEARNQQAEGSDTLTRAKQNWIKGQLLRMKYKNLGRAVRDSNSLHDAYSTYYDALFSESVFPYFPMIGSSASRENNTVNPLRRC